MIKCKPDLSNDVEIEMWSVRVSYSVCKSFVETITNDLCLPHITPIYAASTEIVRQQVTFEIAIPVKKRVHGVGAA